VEATVLVDPQVCPACTLSSIADVLDGDRSTSPHPLVPAHPAPTEFGTTPTSLLHRPRPRSPAIPSSISNNDHLTSSGPKPRFPGFRMDDPSNPDPTEYTRTKRFRFTRISTDKFSRIRFPNVKTVQCDPSQWRWDANWYKWYCGYANQF